MRMTRVLVAGAALFLSTECFALDMVLKDAQGTVLQVKMMDNMVVGADGKMVPDGNYMDQSGKLITIAHGQIQASPTGQPAPPNANQTTTPQSTNPNATQMNNPPSQLPSGSSNKGMGY